MIKFYYGTVGSGKSMHLIANYLDTKRRFPEKDVVLCKPACDTRTVGVYTRFGDLEVPVDVLLDEDVPYWHLANADYLFIDEVQFIPESFLNQLRHAHFGISNVIINAYGLRNDSNKVMWPAVKWLMNNADELIELPTLCDICKINRASFNKALNAIDNAQHSIGFHFIPVCGKCYG